MVKAGFSSGYDTPHACSLWAVGRSVMFCIMAGMEQKNTFRRIFHRCSSWTRLSCPLCATTYALVQLRITVEVPQVQLILKVIYIPIAAQSLISISLTVQQTIEIPTVAVPRQGVDMPVVRATQVQLDKVVVPVVCNDICLGPAAHHSGGAAGAAHHQGHLHPRRGAEFDPHGSDCSADH